MNTSPINANERNYYCALFDRFDVEKSGKISMEVVKCFLSRCGLDQNAVSEIIENSGNAITNYFEKNDFCALLKLAALAQRECGILDNNDVDKPLLILPGKSIFENEPPNNDRQYTYRLLEDLCHSNIALSPIKSGPNEYTCSWSECAETQDLEQNKTFRHQMRRSISHSSIDDDDRNAVHSESHRKSSTTFGLQPEQVTEYNAQFHELFSSTSDGRKVVGSNEVIQLFTVQHNITPLLFNQIWKLCDLDHDNFLDIKEFCLASHIAHLCGHELLSLDEAISTIANYIDEDKVNYLKSNFHDQDFTRPISPDSAEYPLVPIVHSDDDDLFSGGPNVDHTESSPTLSQNKLPYNLEGQSENIGSDSTDEFTDNSISHNVSSQFHNYATDKVATSSASDFMKRQNYLHVESDFLLSDGDSQNSCMNSTDSSDESGSGFIDTVNHNTVYISDSKMNRRDYIKRSINSLRLLSVTTGISIPILSEMSSSRRRRLLSYLIHEAKSVNHTLLRLNNEMQGELAELNDQRVNLSAQLQHLGLHPLPFS